MLNVALNIILSALMYSASLTISSWFWPLSLLFLVPIFYLALQQRLTTLHGLWWGYCATILVSYGEVYSVIVTIPAPLLIKLLIACMVFTYLTAHAAACFFGAYKISSFIRNRYRQHSDILTIVIWSFFLWLFFVWFSDYCFWIFIRCEGYQFIHPLIPLINVSQLLTPMIFLGKHALLFLLIMFQGAVALTILKPSLMRFGLVFASIIAYGLITRTHNTTPKPLWLNRIAVIPRSINQEISVSQVLNTVRCYATAVADQHPEVTLIITPEDSIQSTHFTSHADVALACSPPHKPVTMILGAYRKDNNKQYNTVYWINNQELKLFFDKRHTMIFTERMPPLCGVQLFEKLNNYLEPLCEGTAPRPLLKIDDHLSVVPYVCSELFFFNKPDDNYPTQPILALCSEKWAQFSFIAQRMADLARFKALEWQRDIVYTAYYHSGYCSRNGNYYPLLDVSQTIAGVDKYCAQQQEVRRTNCNIKTEQYEKIENFSAPSCGSITSDCMFCLPLATSHEIFGFSFSQYSPLQKLQTITIAIAPSKDHMATGDSAIFMRLNQDQIYYIDSLTYNHATKYLMVAITPSGLVTITNPTTNESVLISRYR